MSIRSKIQALITAANTKTGESDTTLTDAVQTLVDGYGQGGSGGTDLASVTVYVADFVDEPPTVTSGALNSLHGYIVGH